MKTADFGATSTTDLVVSYIDLSVKDAEASERGEISKIRSLFDQRMKIENVLRSRGPEARRALLPLLKHRHPQVRLDAATHLLGIAPKEARAALEDLAAHAPDQQRGAAGMCLWYVERGIFKPT